MVLGNKKPDIHIQKYLEKYFASQNCFLQLMESLAFHDSVEETLQHAKEETKIPDYKSFSKRRIAQ